MSLEQIIFFIAMAGITFFAYTAGYARALNEEIERRKREEWRARMRKTA